MAKTNQRPQYQFRPETLLEKMQECIDHAMSHSYGSYLLRHTEAYPAGLGISVIALEEISKVFFLFGMASLKRKDPSIRKIQNAATDHYNKLMSHKALLENCIYMASSGAVLRCEDLNIDGYVRDYISYLDQMESPDFPELFHPVFDEVKQRCFYVDISRTPYTKSGKDYISMESACFYASYAEAAIKMCNAAWDIFKPVGINYIKHLRGHFENNQTDDERTAYSMIFMHTTNSYSLFPRTFEAAAENYETMVEHYGWPFPRRSAQEHLELLVQGYKKDPEWHSAHFMRVRSALTKQPQE